MGCSRGGWCVGVLLVVGIWGVGVKVEGQVVGGTSGFPAPAPVAGVPSGAAALPNPFLNPMGNPYLNPYLATTNVPPDVALYYMLQSQRASGGIGSGAISGLRDAEQGRHGQAPSKAKSSTTGRSTASQGAAHYFQRGPNRFGARSGPYFQRLDDRFDH